MIVLIAVFLTSFRGFKILVPETAELADINHLTLPFEFVNQLQAP